MCVCGGGESLRIKDNAYLLHSSKMLLSSSKEEDMIFTWGFPKHVMGYVKTVAYLFIIAQNIAGMWVGGIPRTASFAPV